MAENENGIGGALKRLWERQQKSGLADFAGLDVAAHLPLSQKVIDDLLRPVPLPDAVRNLRLILGGNDLLVLEVTVVTFLFTRSIRIDARVEPTIAFPHEPVLKLTILTGGLIGLILNVVTLPDFIRIDGRQARLDLGMLLRRGGQEWLILLIRELRLSIRPGVAYLDARLTVPERTH